MVTASALVLCACGVDGKIGDYGDTTVYSEPKPNANGGVSHDPVGKLTTLSKVTVTCHETVNGFGFYKISYSGGSGYVDDSTSIMSDDGEVRPAKVPKC
ncbi:hypothetical protein CFP71_15365 [Amycolatopsis thailandensis]|uniref:Uncharacterized protein n=1 Tax=Amycolatopsis thailandensis TaxID=589330 RepID=A0A229SAS4_9PSEU|nr:hypothetical protein CFP71_15365 [Amycolatopsis thailandensis]